MGQLTSSILILGQDIFLLETRRLILEALGYNVFLATRGDEIRHIARDQSVDLLILCHSLTEKECSDATRLAETRWPRIKQFILGTTFLPPQRAPLGDSLLILDGPCKFISIVRSLIDEPAAPLHAHVF